MSWAGLALALVLVGWAVYWTLRPLFRPPDPESVHRPGGGDPSPLAAGEEDARGLLEAKEALYRAIKELEFDYHTGKLSREDFEAMTERYRERALDVLRRLDARGVREGAAAPTRAAGERVMAKGGEEREKAVGDEDLIAELEEEIRALRRVKEPAAVRPAPAPSGEAPEKRNFCPQCGRRVSREDNFCAGCGKKLSED